MLDFTAIATASGFILTALGLWAKWPFVKRKVRAGVERLRKIKQGWQENRQAALRQACVDAGMATRDDVQTLRDDVEKRLSAPAQTEKIPTASLKAVECYGLMFYLSRLCESTYLGKRQPNSLDADTINALIDGRFCPKCRMK